MSARLAALPALLLAACSPNALALPQARDTVTPQQWAATCPPDAGWDDPGPPFRIHADTYYVGTCGIAAILVTGPDGHVLIDSGTEAGALIVADNIRRLGFRLEDIELLLMSHEHHDHTGGMAMLKELTGARLLASRQAAPVMEAGQASADDPQFGLNPGFPAVKVDRTLTEDGVIRLGPILLRAIATPGHTAGALSWQWRSCDGSDCRNIVYADSLSAISNDTYRFSDHSAYIAAFRQGLVQLAATECDMLLTPHPSASGMKARAAAGLPPDKTGCAAYSDTKLAQLEARLAKEAGR